MVAVPSNLPSGGARTSVFDQSYKEHSVFDGKHWEGAAKVGIAPNEEAKPQPSGYTSATIAPYVAPSSPREISSSIIEAQPEKPGVAQPQRLGVAKRFVRWLQR